MARCGTEFSNAPPHPGPAAWKAPRIFPPAPRSSQTHFATLSCIRHAVLPHPTGKMTNDLTTQTVALPAIRAGKFREFVARNDLASFFVLAFLFSWYPWIIALVRGTASGPNPLGPLIAALIVTGLTDGRSGMRSLLGRMVRARIGFSSYAIIFSLPILLCGAAMAIMACFGQPIALPTAPAARELPERFIFILLFIGLGEEPGWRG